MNASGTVLGERYRLDDSERFDPEAHMWRATDLELDRIVAVRIPNEYRTPEKAIASFRRQFDLLSTIDHPGVVHVYDIGLDPAVDVYLVTQYIDIDRDRDRRDRPFRPERVMDLVVQIADALQAVHDRDHVYRNITKGLWIRRDGTTVLDGFYLARPPGSPQLMNIMTSNAALELPATTRTDIFDLGVLAHRFLAPGEETPGGHGNWPLGPMRWPPGISPAIQVLVEKACAINPDDRWPSAAALAEAARQTGR